MPTATAGVHSLLPKHIPESLFNLSAFFWSEDLQKRAKQARKCAKCGFLKNGVANCCSDGGSWEGHCTAHAGDGGHTWGDGFFACRTSQGQEDRQSIQARDSQNKTGSCDKCGFNGASKNCCFPGGSWVNQCDGSTHNWYEGYNACNPRGKSGTWSLPRLDWLFRHGKPSNSLEQAGLLVHGFDGTEDWEKPWMPCSEGWCMASQWWWSASMVTSGHPAAFGDSGVIFAPGKNRVLCSHVADFGSLNGGCKSGVPGGWMNTKPYPPNHLKDMLKRSLLSKGGGYNEVLVSSETFTEHLPGSVAAFYYGLKVMPDADQSNWPLWDAVQAAAAYVKFLDHYKLNESQVPLIKFNLSGQLLSNMATGARRFLKNHPHEQMRDTWLRDHPFLRDHPEKMPHYIRQQMKRLGRARTNDTSGDRNERRPSL